jgi:hypothetical protein
MIRPRPTGGIFSSGGPVSPIPRHINENVLFSVLKRHSGLTGEMGVYRRDSL